MQSVDFKVVHGGMRTVHDGEFLVVAVRSAGSVLAAGCLGKAQLPLHCLAHRWSFCRGSSMPPRTRHPNSS